MSGKHQRFAKKPVRADILWMMYPNYLQIVTTQKSGISATLLFYPSPRTAVVGCLILTAFLAKKWLEWRREAQRRAARLID